MNRSRAIELALDIKHRRVGMKNEDAQAEGIVHRSYARAKKYREQDWARINGMVIGLSYLLDVPLDMQATERFIEETKD